MKTAVLLTIVGICTASILIPDSRPASAAEPRYDVEVEPGLTPQLSPSQIVPKVPGPFGSFRMGGTIEWIERVALVRGQNVPNVDPSLSAYETDVPVWVVICRGNFYFSVPGDVSGASSRGVYLIRDGSGVTEVGILPGIAAPAEGREH